MKPENVLLDSEGYIRIADFGLSKGGVKGQNARSICGTPEYLAPEIVWKMGHGKPVDWWTIGKLASASPGPGLILLGCILYELLTGMPPYYSSSRDRLFQKIMVKPVKYPKKVTPECLSLLKGFFKKLPD